MEIDVTHMVEELESQGTMVELSASRAELGQDAGRITWNNCIEYSKDNPLLKTDDERDAARAHFRDYGAWSEAEIAAWSEAELQAITVQDVAAAIREMEHYDSTADYLAACESGQASGRLYGGADDGKWYFYLGS